MAEGLGEGGAVVSWVGVGLTLDCSELGEELGAAGALALGDAETVAGAVAGTAPTGAQALSAIAPAVAMTAAKMGRRVWGVRPMTE